MSKPIMKQPSKPAGPAPGTKEFRDLQRKEFDKRFEAQKRAKGQ